MESLAKEELTEINGRSEFSESIFRLEEYLYEGTVCLIEEGVRIQTEYF